MSVIIYRVSVLLTPRCIYVNTFRCMGNVNKAIRGPPRPTPIGKTTPMPSKYKFKVDFPKEYTIEPLKLTKLGGRDPETGRVVVETLGGGEKYPYLWIDHFRVAAPGQPHVEKVEEVRRDPVRSSFVALVGSGNKRRWIVATEHMKTGDIIETSVDIPKNTIVGKEGNAYPVGALQAGTSICCIEPRAGQGSRLCNAAGTSAKILRKLLTNEVVVVLPSKKELILDPKCMCVVGRCSNVDYGSTPLGSAQESRWRGHRPRSGHWHRKDGYCGRKIHAPQPPAPPRTLQKDPEILKLHFFSWDKKQKKDITGKI